MLGSIDTGKHVGKPSLRVQVGLPRLATADRWLGGALMAAAMLLEALQALTPDRHCDLQAAFYGVGWGAGGGSGC